MTAESSTVRLVPRALTLGRMLREPPPPSIARELSRIAADRLGRKLAALEDADRGDLRRRAA